MSVNYKLDTFVNSSHRLITNMVREDCIVLDVGCASGYLADILRTEKKCVVYGVEIDPEKASRAEKSCKQVFLGDVDSLQLPEIYLGFFDCIIFADILEHTKNPETIPTRYSQYLKNTGYMIVSLPNVAYWLIRLKLLFGRFDYTDCGIMDKTHLRFFTIKSAFEMIEKCNLEVIDIKYPGRIIHYIKIFPSLFAYQTLLLCRLKQ